MLGVLVLAASLVGGSTPAAACEEPLPQGPRGLPPVAIHTTCGGFALRPNGTVVRQPMPDDGWPTWARSWMRVAPGTYMTRRNNFITLYRGGRVVWRSSRRYRLTESIVASRDAIAFGVYRGPVYVARIGERERAVFRNEIPLAFTPEGQLLTQVWRPHRVILRVRRLDGSLARTIATRARTATFDESTKTLYYVTRGNVVARFDGRRRVGVARVPAGWHWPWLQPLDGGLVAVIGDRGVRIVRPRGGVFADTRFRPLTEKHGGYVLNADAVVARKGAVAFTSSWRRAGMAVEGTSVVSVLRAGDRKAEIVYGHRVRQFGCGWWTQLAWHGDWLLYRAGPAKVVAIDTAGGRHVDLTRFVQRLPGRDEGTVKAALRLQWR